MQARWQLQTFPSSPAPHPTRAAANRQSISVCAGCRPGGIRQQFKAALPLIEGVLRGLRQASGLQGGLNSEIWDQGDAIGAWMGAMLAAVIFPTPDVLRKVRLASNSVPACPISSCQYTKTKTQHKHPFTGSIRMHP